MPDETQPEVVPNPTPVQPPAVAEPEPAPEPPTDPAPEAPAPAVRPVVVNQFTRRSDDDALPGSWVDVVAGEFEGRRGSYVSDETHDPATGYPATVVVRTRDAENEMIVVNYSDIRPSLYTGGR